MTRGLSTKDRSARGPRCLILPVGKCDPCLWPGHLEVPTWIIKDAKEDLVQILTHLINECFKQNTFPDSLKFAIVTPAFKKNLKTDPNNYRPISILSHFSKILEKIVYSQNRHTSA